MKKNIPHRQSGFTLIEMMVASAILGVLVVAGMNYFQNMQQSNNYLEFQMKREQLRIVLLNQFLNDEKSCRCIFKDAQEFPENGIAKLVVPSPEALGRYSFVTDGDCSTATIAMTFINEKGVDGLKLKNVSLVNIKKFDSQYAGELMVYLGSSKKMTGPPVSRMRIPVNVQTGNGSGTNRKFEGCSVAGTFAGQLQKLLEKVIDFSETRCIRDTGSNTMHIVERKCDPGTRLLGCSGGAGDMDDKHEGTWIVPDFKTDTCRLHVVKPACVSSQPWTYQKVIALCYPE